MTLRTLAATLALLLGQAGPQLTAFDVALEGAERALAAAELDQARLLVMRALERDSKAARAWGVRARIAAAAADRDEEVFSLHRELQLLVAQKAPKTDQAAVRARLTEVDPLASELEGMRAKFVAKLADVAASYEKDARPHSAIRVHKEILGLDPESTESQAAIERLAAAPDPSLAADAKPVDLLAGVSQEWMAQFDLEHREWKERAKLERENYTTHTNAGYEVMVRAAEAMEQMNAFYRVFFDYGRDGKGIGRIDLTIFRTREEYLKLGSGPPADWSGGQFTGNAVETYVEGGFETMTGTLFHEAAHQFVSMATSASGWLNEGLASFFEGCRILPNGTVLMNLPANHRLFPLVDRMKVGWMRDETDGIDPDAPSKSEPPKSPTFRIVLENKYEWGPPWYAPTWGVVYFLYNYQDPVDGRYVYRKAFREFINSSGGRVGEGAVKNFEEVVLAHPMAPIAGVERPTDAAVLALPKTVTELDGVWKDWLTRLRDEQSGTLQVERPWLRWARAAVLNKDLAVAQEHFEKGLVATPRDVDLLGEFAEFLGQSGNPDRATKLALLAMRELESRAEPDLVRVRAIERKLESWDPKRATLDGVHRELWNAARALVQGYRDAGLPLMVMDVAWHMEVDLGVPGLFEYYAEAQKQTGKSLAIWQLAYNEKDLEGWEAGSADVYAAKGSLLEGRFGTYAPDSYDYRMLGLDKVTSGDFSLEALVQADSGAVAFCGLVFGRKDANNFHALIYFPPKRSEGPATGTARSGFADLTSFYGSQPKIWRHNPVAAKDTQGQSSSGDWHKLRIDIAGTTVDAWVDDQYLATQEFPSRDVLRGTFGLILGPGLARFREVRFLARHPRDPAALLERERRMQAVTEASGGSVGGSWLGLQPPFPRVGRWAQGQRESWAEAGAVPQLLVLWSIQQNDIVRIDEWLRALAERSADVGLQVLSVASPNDDADLDAYLQSHPFPGAVAVDKREDVGLGETNDLFATIQFNLPRLLLIDLDGKVAWEGDPGFSTAQPYQPGVESYLDTPLNELLERRKVRALQPWLAAWKETGAPALAAGAFATAWPLLQQAREFDAAILLEVREAQRKFDTFTSACRDLAATQKAMEAEGRTPALAQLLDWAAVAGVDLDKRARADAAKALKDGAAKAWERALKQVESRRAKALGDAAVATELASSLRKLEGLFPAQLAERIEQAKSSSALEQVLTDAPNVPARWLAREWFNW